MLDDVFDRYAQLTHHGTAGRREAEAVDADDHAVQPDVLAPKVAYAGFHRHAVAALSGQDGLAIVFALAVKAFHAGHGYNAHGVAQFVGCGESQAQFAAGGEDDEFQFTFLPAGHVAAFEDAGSAFGHGNLVEVGDALTGEDEARGTVRTLNGGDEGGSSFLGVGGADDVEVGNDSKTADSLDGLVGGTVLANAYGVVRPDVENGQADEGGDADGGAHVVREDGEGGAGGPKDAVIAETVDDGPHSVLANTEEEVAAGVVVPEKVSLLLHVVLGGTVKVGGAGYEKREGGSEVVDDLGTRRTGSELGVLGKGLDAVHEVGGDFAGEAGGEEGRLLGVGGLPGFETGVPSGVVGGLLGLAGIEVGPDLVGNVKGILGEAEAGAGFGGKLGPAFSVAGGGTGDLGNAFADKGLHFDELGLAILVCPGSGEGVGEEAEVVTVLDALDLEAVGSEAIEDAFALGGVGHGVEGDVVGIVKEDEVVQTEVTSKGGGFGGHAFLEAAVPGEAEDMVVEDGVLGGVEGGAGELGGDSHADCVAHALPEWAGGTFHAGSFTELGVAGRLAVELAEVADLLDRKVEAGEVEPTVKEHAAVAGGEDEAVSVDPVGVGGVVPKLAPVENSSDLGGSEGQSEVPGTACVYGVDGEAPSLRGGLLEKVFVQIAHGKE